jgi:hypothetical protein
VIGGDAVVAELAHPPRQLRIVGRHHPALAGGDVLDGVEAERVQVRERSHRTVPVGPARCVARVGHQGQPVPGSERPQVVVIRRLPGVIDGDDRLRARRDPGFDPFGVQEQRGRIDVREHRRSALVDDAVGRRGERERRDDDLVARPDPQGERGGVEGRRAAVDGHPLARPDRGGERLFEPPDQRSGREPVGPQRRRHGGHVVVVDPLSAVGEHPRANRFALAGAVSPVSRHDTPRPR